MKGTLGLFLEIALLIAGCSPGLQQLQQAKTWAAAANYASIAGEPVSCGASQPGCGQLRAIKADACRRVAVTEAVAAHRGHLDCAIENYGAALGAATDPEVDRVQAELGLLDVLQRRRDVAADRVDADRQNRALAERAAAASGPNVRPAGAYYAADAELNSVLRSTAQGGCTEIAHAAQLLRDAGTEGTSFTAAAGALTRAVANARRARGCTT